MWRHSFLIIGLPLLATNVAAQPPVTPLFRLERELVISATENDLSPIGWLAVASDGTLAISQPQDHNIRFFSSAGRSAAAFGRKGKGPGEFETPNFHGWIGDTLWVSDIDTKRVTVISPSRTLLRTQLWPPGIRFREGTTGPLPSFIFAVPWAMYRDGTFLTFAYLATETLPAWMQRPPNGFQPFIRVRADGLFQRVVHWILEPNKSCYVGSPAGQASRPFCFQPFWSVSRAGGVVTVVGLERSDPETDYVRTVAVSSTGDTLFSRVMPVGRVRIPRAVADSAKDSFVRQQWRGVPAPSLDLPETFAPYLQAIIARDERSMWLERGVTLGERVWDIFDMSGQPVGTIRVPRNVEIRAVTLERVWAAERDQDGLESIVIFRLRR